MDRPNLLGPVRDYRAELKAYLDDVDIDCRDSTSDRNQAHFRLVTVPPLVAALRAMIADGSVAMHCKMARVLGLERKT